MELKQKVSIINNAVEEILTYGKDLNKSINDFEQKISDINRILNNLNSNRIKLINHLFKHSKRKDLFKYDFKRTGDYCSRTYVIGSNAIGLGLCNNYEHQLRNLDGYYPKQTFFELVTQEDFKKLLIEHTKDEFKSIITGLFIQDEICLNQKVQTPNMNILIDESGLSISERKNDNSIRIIGKPNNNNFEVDNYLKTFFKGDTIFHFDYDQIVKYAYVLQFKEEIIKALDTQTLKLDEIQAKLTVKDKEVQQHLNPFEALKNI
jgi:hypothetical protein